jgi:proline dehydrogenase
MSVLDSVGAALRVNPISRSVLSRIDPAERVIDALSTAQVLADGGRWISLERSLASVSTSDLTNLAAAIGDSGLAGVCELAVFPTEIGAEGTLQVAEACAQARVDLMLGFGDDADMDQTFALADECDARGANTGVTVSACLRRTENDCHVQGHRRLRLVKGAHQPAGGPIFSSRHEVDKSYIRCVRALIADGHLPSFATHDPRIIEMIEAIADRQLRAVGSYEFAFYLGHGETQQQRLMASGHRIRVSVPFGPDFVTRLVGGLAQQSGAFASTMLAAIPRVGR